MVKKVLVTGETVFVSRFIAEYYVKKGYEVYVLNRNTKKQSEGVHLIESDRYDLGEKLRNYSFDLVVDNGYNANEVELLLEALGEYQDYILISSSAVYPEYEVQPMKEEAKLAVNKFWRQYGTDKIEAEKVLLDKNPNAYIVRPPYLYGPMNNVYREGFVFDCAMADRKFYLPKDGAMKLQFFHIEDLCRFMDVLIELKPKCHIYNVGNKEAVTIKEWVSLCYEAAGKKAEYINVMDEIEQRNYFSFYDYEYILDVSKQDELMPVTKPLLEGLKESFDWYTKHSNQVNRRDYFGYIDHNL